MRPKPAVSHFTCEAFEEYAKGLPFEVDAYDTFNKLIQATIEICPAGELQTKLAVIKFNANKKFDEIRRGVL